MTDTTKSLKVITAFSAGVIVMFCFEYPALNTAVNGLNDKNAAIERLQTMVRECK